MSSSVGIVYHYWARYREPVIHKLMALDAPEFTIYSDFETFPKSIRGIEPELSTRPVSEGGLRWGRLKNHWLTSVVLWQSGVIKLVLSDKHDGYIFLGSMYHLSTWFALIVCKLRGIPVYLWTHGVKNREAGLKGQIRRVFYKLANGLLLYGDSAKDILIEQGFSKESLLVIYNSLDFDLQQEIMCASNTKTLERRINAEFQHSDAPMVVFIGRLIKKKKLDLILQALALLEKKNQYANVAFVGEGEAKADLVTKAKSILCKSEVKFFGALYEEVEVGPVLMSATVCISPGFVGLTAMHALGYGVPVISHNNIVNQSPEYEAIIEGVTGSLFQEDSVEDLALAMSYWLFENPDRISTKKACIDVIRQRYNPDVQVELIANLFKKI